jgi:hypothetical protein
MWSRAIRVTSGSATSSGGVPGADALRRVPGRQVLSGVLAFAAVCALEVVVLAGTSEYRGFVAGLVAATAFWLVALRLLGPEPTAATPDREARRLGRDLVDGVPQWLAVHDLPLGDRTIDHVVVTPLAVLAVTSQHWDGSTSRQQVSDRARDDARRLARSLGDLGVDVPVWPAVLAWGPQAPATELGPVDLVAGSDAATWTAAYRTGAIGRRRAEQAHAAMLRLCSGGDRRLLDLRDRVQA